MRVHAPKAARREDENGAGKPRDLAVLDHGFMAHAEWGRPLLLDRVPRLELPEAPSGEPRLRLVLDKAQVGLRAVEPRVLHVQHEHPGSGRVKLLGARRTPLAQRFAQGHDGPPAARILDAGRNDEPTTPLGRKNRKALEYEPLGQVLHWPHARIPRGSRCGAARGQERHQRPGTGHPQQGSAARSHFSVSTSLFTNRRCMTIITVAECTMASIDGAALVTLALVPLSASALNAAGYGHQSSPWIPAPPGRGLG